MNFVESGGIICLKDWEEIDEDIFLGGLWWNHIVFAVGHSQSCLLDGGSRNYYWIIFPLQIFILGFNS